MNTWEFCEVKSEPTYNSFDSPPNETCTNTEENAEDCFKTLEPLFNESSVKGDVFDIKEEFNIRLCEVKSETTYTAPIEMSSANTEETSNNCFKTLEPSFYEASIKEEVSDAQEEFNTGHEFNGLQLIASFSKEDKQSDKTIQKRLQTKQKMGHYRCKECKFKTIYRSSMNRHVNTHKSNDEVTIYTCNTCSFSTKWQRVLNRHLKKHNKTYSCDKCSFKTNYSVSFSGHQKQHDLKDSVQLYHCTECDYQSVLRQTLIKHCLTTHKDLVGTSDLFRCTHCSYHSRWKFDVLNHEKCHLEVLEDKEFKCDKCPYQSESRAVLKAHKQCHTERNTYKCDLCEFEAAKKAAMERHKLKHKSIDEVTLLQCDQCPFQSRYKESITNHLKTHLNRKHFPSYKCSSCDYHTIHRCNLIRHLTVKHTSEGVGPVFRCDQCPYQSKLKQELKNHQRRKKHVNSSNT